MWHEIAMVRGFLIVAMVGLVQAAQAQPAAPPSPANAKAAPLVGATEVAKLTAPAGFVDDPIATDDTRIAYVIADASTKAELHVAPIGGAGGAETVVDIASVTLHPVALRLVGQRAFVVGQLADGNQVAAMVELAAAGKKPAGRVAYKLGPATQITVIRDSSLTSVPKYAVALHRATPSKDGGTRHEITMVNLDTGKLVNGKPLELDSKDANAKLDFHVNHWSDGYRFAWGIKGGEWDKKENQRTPDVEAKYDVSEGKFKWQQAIEDKKEQVTRFQTLAAVHDTRDFLRMTWDNGSVQIWHDGKPTTVTLDEPITHYDPKSLQGVVQADGSAWIVLKTDPVNPDAVARKKADPDYLDIFKAGADGKAVRKARVLAPSARFWFGVMNDAAGKIWLLERSNGFDRGGKTLTVYQLAS